MPCSATLSGLVRDCEPNAGGVKALYIANKDDVSDITLDSTGAKISAVTMASSAKFKGFYFKPGQATVTLTGAVNEAGDYAGEDGVISVNFGRMDTSKRTQMHALSIAELVVIYTDNNGISWLLGYDNPVLRNGGESGTGTARTDHNHYGLELHSSDLSLPFEVPSSVLAGIIG